MKQEMRAIRDDLRELSKRVMRLGAAPKVARAAPRPQARSRVAGRIKEARQKLGLSQGGFARRVGVSQVCVYLWESGRTTPQGKNIEKLKKLGAKLR